MRESKLLIDHFAQKCHAKVKSKNKIDCVKID